ncbi:WhiB family transcriptional regulator [Streptomyces sp. Wb2n-11]|uniref:WhiB family transcriptional regulator n=1 Tax=Streptomyces sp. Wb2n-11 TaxID=1030533 RepID=UPI000B147563|nr:WhiB family transcriptional regulator [Streptomyces sp. Wb2n-11]
MTPTTPRIPTARTAEITLVDHPYYRYRGCAPDPERPGMAAGADLPHNTWIAPDVDGGEEQTERRARENAAIAVCHRCPVLRECAAFANSETDDGHLALESGIAGGTRALDRHRDLIARRLQAGPIAAPDKLPAQVHTAQKQAVLRALAAHVSAEAVAEAAGMDLRTAAWQRSRLVTLLGLDKATATRRELLDVAVRAGLLDGVQVVACDGTVPAVPPPPAPAPAPVLITAAAPAPAAQNPPAPAAAPGPAPAAAVDDAAPYVPVRIPSPRRARFTKVPGQLQLPLLDPAGRTRLHLVPTLPATHALEPAA